MTTVLGWAGADDDSPLRLAAAVALASAEPLVVASVVPPDPDAPIVSRVDREYRAWRDTTVRERQEAAVGALRSLGVDEVRGTVVRATSEPAGLVDAVRREDAGLLVLGAAAAAPTGRFSAGSVAERLLHSSPVPLALAPRDCGPVGPPSRLTCAWAGTARSAEALTWTRRLARRWGVPVRLVTFAPERAAMLPSETGLRIEQTVSEEWAAQAQGRLDDVVGAWEGDPPETVVARGAGWAGALAAVPWASGDLLVVGSSRLGPLARVFLGSTASRILRHSPVPVVVVPAGAGGSPTRG